MGRIKVFLLAVSTVFLVASCGTSSTASTAPVTGLEMPAKVSVL